MPRRAAPPPPPNPAATLEEQVKATKALLNRRKMQYAQATQAGEEPPIGDLAAITKLETQLANLEQYLRLRNRHRAKQLRDSSARA